MTRVPDIEDVDAMVEWFLAQPDHPTAAELRRAGSALGRNLYPELISSVNVYLLLSPETLREVLPEAWTGAEFPASVLAEDDWLYLFEEAGLTIDGKEAPRPSEDVHLYRGADPLHAYGWSWTPDLEQAKWFKDRFNFKQDRQVWETWAPPESILAILTGTSDTVGRPGQSEYVLNPEELTLVRQVIL